MSAPHPLYVFLRTLRTRTGLSIEKAAPTVGVRPSTLAAYESGRRNATVTQLDGLLRRHGWRLAPVPADITDAQIAEAPAWITARQGCGPVELGAVA